MREIYIEIAKLAIMLMCAAVTRFLIPWIKSKTDNAVMQSLIDWTMQAVLAAEQTHGAGTGAEKKQIVREFIQKILAQKGVELTDEEIDTMIEAAVKQIQMGA